MKQNFQKNKLVTGKTQFFVIGPFCAHGRFTDVAVFNHFFQSSFQNDTFLILAFSTKETVLHSSFLKKVFVFQKIYCKVEVLKTPKVSAKITRTMF